MTLIDEETQKWYCYRDDEVFLAKEQRWGADRLASSELQDEPFQTCHCGRSKPHVHYSENHSFLVKLGVGLVILLEAIAFIVSNFKSSVRLYFGYQQLQDYYALSAALTQLLAPFDYLSTIILLADVFAIVFTFIALLTLRSPKTKLHLVSLVGALSSFFAEWVIASYYIYLTDQAMKNLPSLLTPDVLNDALQVQQQFEAAYGFWDSSAYSAVRIVLVIVTLGSFVVASFTSRPTLWNPNISERVAIPTPPRPPQLGSSGKLRSAGVETKFCRYCGAKIPRTSKFCEECGKNLVQ